MKISPQGLTFIRQFEGFSPLPYRCPAGYWTVGYGHVLTSRERSSMQQVTPEAALIILEHDVRIAEQSVTWLINVPLRQNQFDALVSFTYNLGAAALQRSTLRRVINRGDHTNAPREFERWVWAAGHKLPGLIRRRQAEAWVYQKN